MLYNNLGGLPFWNETQILFREQAISRLALSVRNALISVNSAWQFERMEGPTLTPMDYISPAYGEDDLFMLQAEIGGRRASMRAETTASSFVYAEKLLSSGVRKLPLCVWQAGKSYRRETNDGARASTLRFNEFWQLEFQCIYAATTKADYQAVALPAVAREIARITGKDSRLAASDRLPAYSEMTTDVEVPWKRRDDQSLNKSTTEWKEMASISLRTDFPEHKVLEIAIGLDRLVCVATAMET